MEHLLSTAFVGKAAGGTPERSLLLTQVMDWNQGVMLPHEDALAAEEPLEIRIGDGKVGYSPISVTMRTAGHDEELAAGFVWSEGIVDRPTQIGHVESCVTSAAGKKNAVHVELRDSGFEPAQLQRNFFTASGCGICGKASINAIRQRGLRVPNRSFRFGPELLCRLQTACARRRRSSATPEACMPRRCSTRMANSK